MKRSSQLAHQIKQLLLPQTMQTHEEIARALAQVGYRANQSSISRVLHKLRAVKGLNPQGQLVYLLPPEPLPLPPPATLTRLVERIAHNEQLITIHTTPGSASVIARLLDLHQAQCHILGTLAGDDTILVIPAAIAELTTTLAAIKQLLS